MKKYKLLTITEKNRDTKPPNNKAVSITITSTNTEGPSGQILFNPCNSLLWDYYHPHFTDPRNQELHS